MPDLGRQLPVLVGGGSCAKEEEDDDDDKDSWEGKPHPCFYPRHQQPDTWTLRGEA